jgi:hypothetical protein
LGLKTSSYGLFESNKRHDIAEILLKVALSTINQPTNLSIAINVVSSNVARYNMIMGVASIEAKTKIRCFIFRFLFMAEKITNMRHVTKNFITQSLAYDEVKY